MPYLQAGSNSQLHLAVYIQPKASKNRLMGCHGTELKIAITAPPVDGKANKAVIAFIAKFFKLAKGDITISRGQQSRHKQLTIKKITYEEARQQLNSALDG